MKASAKDEKNKLFPIHLAIGAKNLSRNFCRLFTIFPPFSSRFLFYVSAYNSTIVLTLSGKKLYF